MSLRKLTVAALWAATVAAAQQPFDLDPNFRTTIQQQGIGSILERPDGEIIVSGSMYYPSQFDLRGGILLTADGAVNSTFPAYGYMGGKIVPWGADRFYAGNGQGIRRSWLDDGALDNNFNALNQPLYSIFQGGDFHVFPDGRVLISGLDQVRDSVRGFVGWYSLIWLNNDGSLDTTRIHRQSEGPIVRFKELPDGKFICNGSGGMVQGRNVSILFRVDSDGALDTTFNAPFLDYCYTYSYHPQSDGKVVCGGRYHFVGSPDTLSLIRLLPDGQLDPTFNNHLAFRSTYHHLATPSVLGIQPIGPDKLAITGSFDQIDGETRGGIAMVDTAGNLLDGYFNSNGCGAYEDGFQQYPYKFIVGITPAMDESYYIYGAYHGYDDGTTNDTSQRLISRLYGLNVGIHEQEADQPQPLQIAPNPSAGSTVFSAPAPLSNTELYIHDGSGRLVWQVEWPAGAEQYTLPAGALAPGAYVVRVAHAGTVLTCKCPVDLFSTIFKPPKEVAAKHYPV